MEYTRDFIAQTKTVTIPIVAIFDEMTSEPTCARLHSDNPLQCRFYLVRHFGTQPVCGFGENIDLTSLTSLKLVKPHSKCVLHNETHSNISNNKSLKDSDTN